MCNTGHINVSIVWILPMFLTIKHLFFGYFHTQSLELLREAFKTQIQLKLVGMDNEFLFNWICYPFLSHIFYNFIIQMFKSLFS